MNRSRYIPSPNPVYSVNPYQQQQHQQQNPHQHQQHPHQQQQHQQQHQQQQQYGLPPGMMSFGSPPLNLNQGHSPLQISPNTTSSNPNMWTTAPTAPPPPPNFANGPIIEDLCAPPPPHMTMGGVGIGVGMGMGGMGMPGSGMMNGMPLPPHHRMPPQVQAQVQNVYGLRPGGGMMQGMQGIPGMPGGGMPMPGAIQSSRVMGTYPPYTGQQHGVGVPFPPPTHMMPPQYHQQHQQHHQQQQQQQQHLQLQQQRQQEQQQRQHEQQGLNPFPPRLDTAFMTGLNAPKSAVSALPGPGGPAMGQMASPELGLGLGMGMGLGMGLDGSPNSRGGPGGDGNGGPLTPVEEALRGFLSPDLGELGDLDLGILEGKR